MPGDLALSVIRGLCEGYPGYQKMYILFWDSQGVFVHRSFHGVTERFDWLIVSKQGDSPIDVLITRRTDRVPRPHKESYIISSARIRKVTVISVLELLDHGSCRLI
jgi:hypothetical protein